MKIDYANKKISLLTKHGKEKIIAPILERTLGLTIELVQSFDTDELGTFDRIVEREGTQLQTVRRKAHIGIDFSRNNLGLASEGSFVPDPFSGFMPWNIEMVIFVDDLNGVEVGGNFGCRGNRITSLEGAPSIVNGYFDCSSNKLTSLEGCPKKIKGAFYCSNNQLTSLEGCPEEIGFNFTCHTNNLVSLEGCPKVVKGYFDCTGNTTKFTVEQVRAVCKVSGEVYV